MSNETKVKERPIIFSDDMVRAILEGRKTMTRRVVKHRDVYVDVKGLGMSDQELKQRASEPAIIPDGNFGSDDVTELCPYGKPGDRLWVKETWAKYELSGVHHYWGEFVYKASRKGLNPLCEGFSKWKSPMFMPRAASRLLLDIVSVRAERLQDIGAEDCFNEGACSLTKDVALRIGNPWARWNCATAKEQFARLWYSLNGKKPGCSWNDNPWVWVIEFKRVDE